MAVESWLLDARPGARGLVLSLYSERDRRIYEREVDLPFLGYLRAAEPERAASELVEVGLAERAWVEDWYAPPYYVGRERLVVFEVRSLKALGLVLRESSKRGIEPVNTFPHPVVRSLYAGGLRPATKVSVGRSVEPLEWDPAQEDPRVDVARVYIDGGGYVLETADGSEHFSEIGDLAARVSSGRYHVGIAGAGVYTRLVEEEPAVSSSAHLWIVGEPHSAAEYFEWSRLSYTPLGLMSNVTIGKVLSTIESLEAMDRRYYIKAGVRRAEPFRSMEQLLLYDRGGVVYQPKPGLYWHVCQIDFRSLYPSIIARYNVSGETVDAPGCSTHVELEWTPHRVCVDREGVVPAGIRRLLELKRFYEDLYRETGLGVYDARRRACKWVLVASFGYLGYRNGLFGSVSAHEVVTSTSRHVMTVARKTLRGLGYAVVHSIVDGVFVGGVPSEATCARLSEAVAASTGFETKVESYYTWLYIPRNLDGPGGSSNRYLGRLPSGEVKAKGLLCVRGDVPQVVKRAQLEALAELARGGTPKEMLEAVRRASEVVRRYSAKVSSGELGVHELLMHRDGSHRRSPYVRPPAYTVSGGGPPYLLCATRGGLKACSPGLEADIDPRYYTGLLERALRELPSEEDVLGGIQGSGTEDREAPWP